mgnify:CR=1 FL=1
MHRRGDVAVGELQTVVSVIGVGLAGEASLVECPIKPVATTIAGKHPTGAITAMGSRRQADDQQPRSAIADPGEWFGPVIRPNVAAWRLSCAGLAPTDQTRALPASNDACIKFIDAIHGITSISLINGLSHWTLTDDAAVAS